LFAQESRSVPLNMLLKILTEFSVSTDSASLDIFQNKLYVFVVSIKITACSFFVT
jgi:hypothetical protein